MPLTVAVQMDPIERIRIAGDFDLRPVARGAGARACASPLHARPTAPRGRLASSSRPNRCASRTFRANTSASARRSASISPRSTSCCCARTRRSISPTSRRPICSSASTPARWWSTIPAAVRDAPEKLFVMDFPELMPPTLIARDREAIEAFRARAWRSGDEAALRRRRSGGVQGRGQGSQFRFAVRPLFRHLPRALGDPEVPAGGRRRRQAHHPRRRRAARRGQPRAGRRRHPLQHGPRRRGAGNRTHAARARDLRGDRAGAEAPRPRLRRHRRHRRAT